MKGGPDWDLQVPPATAPSPDHSPPSQLGMPIAAPSNLGPPPRECMPTSKEFGAWTSCPNAAGRQAKPGIRHRGPLPLVTVRTWRTHDKTQDSQAAESRAKRGADAR